MTPSTHYNLLLLICNACNKVKTAIICQKNIKAADANTCKTQKKTRLVKRHTKKKKKKKKKKICDIDTAVLNTMKLHRIKVFDGITHETNHKVITLKSWKLILRLREVFIKKEFV